MLEHTLPNPPQNSRKGQNSETLLPTGFNKQEKPLHPPLSKHKAFKRKISLPKGSGTRRKMIRNEKEGARI